MVRKCDNHEKIGKVSLDYTFYSGNDEYSDGDVEDTILDIVKLLYSQVVILHNALLPIENIFSTEVGDTIPLFC